MYVGGTYRDGKIELHRPVDWPDGAIVATFLPDPDGGLLDGVWPADGSESGRAEILARMDAPDDDDGTEIDDPFTPEKLRERKRLALEAQARKSRPLPFCDVP